MALSPELNQGCQSGEVSKGREKAMEYKYEEYKYEGGNMSETYSVTMFGTRNVQLKQQTVMTGYFKISIFLFLIIRQFI